MLQCIEHVQSGFDAVEEGLDRDIFVGRVVRLVVVGIGDDDGRDAQEPREDILGHRPAQDGHNQRFDSVRALDGLGDDLPDRERR